MVTSPTTPEVVLVFLEILIKVGFMYMYIGYMNIYIYMFVGIITY